MTLAADRRRFVYTVSGLTALGFLLRAAFIAQQPLWRDEAFTALAVRQPTQEMLDVVSHDSAPPLAYLLNHAVTTLTSTSPPALRLVSLLAGTLMIPLGAALGRRAAGDRAGIWAAIACTVLPMLVMTSRDARMYALAATFVMATTLALWRYLDEPSTRRLTLYALVCSVALLTEYFAIFAIASLFAATYLAYRPPWVMLLKIALSNMAAAAVLIPWLLRARAQFSHAQSPFWVEPVGIKTIAGTVVQFFSGPPIDPGVPLKIGLQVFQGFAVAAGGLALLVIVLRRHSLTLDQRFAITYLAIAGGGGMLMLAAISVWHPLLEARYASVGWGPLAVLIGLGASLVERAAFRRAGAVAMAAASVVLSVAVTHPDTPAVIGYLSSHGTEFIDATPSEYLLVLSYADPGVRQRTHVVARDVAWFWGTAVYPPDAVVPEVPPGSPILLMVTATNDPDAAPPAGYTATAVWCVTGTCVTTLTLRR